uniref:Biotin carboxyl carrier protein of acetyl-CoA carboxylase n=1 Tax=Brassica napus TaxID=3708 RepID=Q39348_BRANA|nr:Biotin carboxyl carrier protein [Brassica napus]prf//2210244C Ac-CoA carboxylase:ISOTYPE=bp3 [Brassica napus]
MASSFWNIAYQQAMRSGVFVAKVYSFLHITTNYLAFPAYAFGPSSMMPPPPMAGLPMPPSPPVSLPAPSSAPATEKPATAPSSSHPPLKSPMAGTFYRSPGPGEPPFVKVGDKVQKGQVVCIIEAMKLMNEIEAEKSGTITELLAEDGKPVSVDTPLFTIVP